MSDIADKIAAEHRVRVFQFAPDQLECKCGTIFRAVPPEEWALAGAYAGEGAARIAEGSAD